MENQNINSTLCKGERVTSTYNEIYFSDTYCKPKPCKLGKKEEISDEDNNGKDEWVSPSDLLIDIVELKPPFTSKITRGQTHEGILSIGNEVLEMERTKFLNSLSTLLEDNDASWNHILISSKEEVVKKVKEIFLNIYKYKSEIMKQEVSNFYEHTLQELEDHLRSEIHMVLQSVHANVNSQLNNEIQQKLKKEKNILIKVLTKKYVTEIEKIKLYYKLLLDNELYRNSQLINKALYEKNDALRAFYKQIEATRLSSTMYIMSLERKKCTIKKKLLEKFHTTEIAQIIKKINDKKLEIDSLKDKDVPITNINKQWEVKIKKILQLFLKFISFSLKLLPEQTTFLLDLEKMVVLQLNEIQKNPNVVTSVLYQEEDKINLFKFPEQESTTTNSVCEKEPFVLIGDLSDPIPPCYGSRETLPSDVDLPVFRFRRQYVYAKCHGYESIKKFLESQICRCNLPSSEQKESLVKEEIGVDSITKSISMLNGSESSNESIIIDEFLKLHECPVRKCFDWIKRNNFPYLPSYVEYSEENFNRVTAILGKIPKNSGDPPKLINPKDIAESKLPFSATKQIRRSVETQYSSQEDLTLAETTCPCIGNTLVKHAESHYLLKSTSSDALKEVLQKRKISLQRLMEKNPNLLKLFTDESFDYKL